MTLPTALIHLQTRLNIIDDFCKETGMNINLETTEVIVFRNGGPVRDSDK